jgi:chromate transporter
MTHDAIQGSMEEIPEVSQKQILPFKGLPDIFWTFLKIGSTAFGGFMALISVVENSVVQRRKLLTHEEMLDGISLASVLPGPVAVNVVTYTGYKIGGIGGAITSGIGVLLPAYFLVLGFTIVYLQAGEIPAVSKAFAGFVPAMVAIILAAAWGVAKKVIGTLKNSKAILITITAALLLKFVGGFYTTLLIVGGSGLLGYWLYHKAVVLELAAKKTTSESSPFRLSRNLIVSFLVLAGFLGLYLIPLPFLENTSLAKLFVVFSGMSLTLFGSGYVFIPIIQQAVVNTYGWVTPTEFASAIALGQITPGPILISAAFIGYAVKGVLGSLVATIGIFFPPAMLMVTCSHLLEQIKQSSGIQAALKGIRPAVLGMIITAAVVLAETTQVHWVSAVIFIASMASLLKLRMDVIWIIPAAGILGILLYP